MPVRVFLSSIQRVRFAIFVMKLGVGFYIVHELLYDRVPFQWTVKFIGDVTQSTHGTRAVADFYRYARVTT